MDLSSQDRDMTIRTVLGEAGDQLPAGQAGVASVIFNRVNSPQWGGTPSSVVLAPGQFEPWGTKARGLLNIDPNSPEYQSVAKIVDGVASGDIPDPTNGATHFLSPSVMASRNKPLPSWASGRSVDIGGHRFFYSGEGSTNMASNEPDKSGAPASGVSDDDVVATAKALGLKVPELAPAPAAKPGKAAIPDVSIGSLTAQPAVSGAGVSDDDVNSTARALGLKLDNPQTVPKLAAPKAAALPLAPSPSDVANNSMGGGYQKQIVEGMPIIGPLFDKALAATGAAIQPVMGAKDAPANFGDRYTKNLADIQGSDNRFAASHPIGSTVANLGGGGAVLGPVAKTALGGLALGTTGPSFASQVLSGTAGGAGIGSLDALLRGESPLTGAEIGGAGGALGSVAGEGARNLVRSVGNAVLPRAAALKNLSTNAVNRLLSATEGETPASLADSAQRMGPPGFVGDVNPAMTDIAGGIADTPGPGKQVVREAYQARAKAQRSRVDQAITDAYGVPAGVNVGNFKNFLTETRAAASDPLYEQFRSMSVHPTDALKDMMPRLEASGAFNMAEELSGISGKPINKKFFTSGTQKEYPTAEAWDYVKRGLDRRIDQAYAGGDKTLARELVTLKREMVGEIEKTDAGKVWKQARTEFADRSAIMDQLDAGRDDLVGGRSGLSADEMADELSTLRGPELAARKVGQRAAIEQAMGDTVRGDTTLRNKLLAPNNVAKLKLTLGDAKAEALIDAMNQEKYLGDQYQNVVGGSQTTPKKERVNALAAPAMQPWDLDLTKPMTYLPPSWRDQFALHGLVNAWRGQDAARAAEELAPIMTTPASDPRHGALLRALLSEGQRRAPWEALAGRTGRGVTSLAAPVSSMLRQRLLAPQPPQ